MTMSVRDAGVFKNVGQLAFHDAGVWKTVQQGYVRDAGVWKPFHIGGPLNAVKSGNVSGSCFTGQFGGSCTATSTTVVITATGGTGNYTYAWARLSGDTITINNPTGASTSFTRNSAAPNGLSGVYRCTVNDGVSTFLVDVTVNLQYNDLS